MRGVFPGRDEASESACRKMRTDYNGGMKVYINNREIRIFAGAEVKDALLACSPRLLAMVLAEKLVVLDRFGNRTEPDGPLLDGQRFTLTRARRT